MFFTKRKKIKEMLFTAVLGDLEWKIFFTAQPWWGTFKISSVIIFVRKTHESFLKS